MADRSIIPATDEQITALCAYWDGDGPEPPPGDQPSRQQLVARIALETAVTASLRKTIAGMAEDRDAATARAMAAEKYAYVSVQDLALLLGRDARTKLHHICESACAMIRHERAQLFALEEDSIARGERIARLETAVRDVYRKLQLKGTNLGSQLEKEVEMEP